MKKLIGLFALLVILLRIYPYAETIAFAQGNEPPIPPAPTNGNVVLDTLDWLTPDQETEINAINKKLDAEGIAQIAVVTLNDCGADKKKFRYDLFNTWGIGHANDNDGLLILVCWYGGDQSRRSIEQETGYGLEASLPGALTDRVAREYFVTAFQAEHPGNGLVAMVRGYDRLLRHLPTPQPAIPTQHPASNPLAEQPQTYLFLSGLGFVVLIIIALLVRRIYVMDATQLTRRGEQGQEREKKKIVLIIASLVAGSVTIFLAVTVHISIALGCALISALVIGIISAAPNGGRGGGGSIGDSGWYSGYEPGHGSSSSGNDGGGGFGGGSSGGGGSSTGF